MAFGCIQVNLILSSPLFFIHFVFDINLLRWLKLHIKIKILSKFFSIKYHFVHFSNELNKLFVYMTKLERLKLSEKDKDLIFCKR